MILKPQQQLANHIHGIESKRNTKESWTCSLRTTTVKLKTQKIKLIKKKSQFHVNTTDYEAAGNPNYYNQITGATHREKEGRPELRKSNTARTMRRETGESVFNGEDMDSTERSKHAKPARRSRLTLGSWGSVWLRELCYSLTGVGAVSEFRCVCFFFYYLPKKIF